MVHNQGSSLDSGIRKSSFHERQIINPVIPNLAGSEVISPFSKGGLRGI
jgi:hypothetical protein